MTIFLGPMYTMWCWTISYEGEVTKTDTCTLMPFYNLPAGGLAGDENKNTEFIQHLENTYSKLAFA